MASVDDLKQPYSTTSPSPIDLPQPPPPPAATNTAAAAANISAPAMRPSQSYLARVAFLILAALTSASWFVEPFAAAAGNLRLPMPAAAAAPVIVLLFAALFYASIHFFRSFFLARPPVAAMLQWERIGAVGAGFAACLVAAGGFAYRYEYPPARS
ncbi:unnamed protein product [Miscanthus lutarioriparius]|uniref:Uncharacterized protein n=1 Tax=Miscanthus lutarioriparius TaxID=422564 RepID=A0A811ND13_9POAL|nr:unnamed protein product [Miscanthus lutarioriparius]